MRTYQIRFVGRLKGAIGKFSRYEVEVKGENREDAVRNLYDTYEHISVEKIKLVVFVGTIKPQ